MYRSVPGKRPWALRHNSQFRPARALTRDITSVCLYGSCNSDSLKFGTWVLTREWVLARDTMVIYYILMLRTGNSVVFVYTQDDKKKL